MAWFNPPLYKHGNKKCPNCGERVAWLRLWVWSWGQWNCRSCRSILAKDGVRLIPGWFLLVPFIAVAATIELWKQPLWVAALFWFGVVTVAAFAEWWLGSIVLRRAGQAESGPPLKT